MPPNAASGFGHLSEFDSIDRIEFPDLAGA
jgi:hypothetical protein